MWPKAGSPAALSAFVHPLPRQYRWAFRTKLAMAAELVHRLATWTRWRDASLRLVTDGTYASRQVLRAARAEGVTVFSRLRRDAAVYHLPPPRRPGQRGRPRVYGAGRISLALGASVPGSGISGGGSWPGPNDEIPPACTTPAPLRYWLLDRFPNVQVRAKTSLSSKGKEMN